MATIKQGEQSATEYEEIIDLLRAEIRGLKAQVELLRSKALRVRLALRVQVESLEELR